MKNKILHIYLLLILSTLAGIAQTISPTVKPSQGGSFTNGNLQMQFTIGEPLNQTFTAGGYEVSLGFQQPQPNIAIAALATGPYCAGTQISIPFTTKDMLGASTYTAQLSDSSGSFASPVSIGVDTTLGYDTITATIPATVTGGMHYRVRVVASVPVFVGGVSAYFQVIHLTATISNSGVYCSNDSINLNASPNGMASYGWSGPDSFSSTAQNPKFPASGNAGTYTVTVTNSVGCSATSSTVVIVNQAPWQLTPSFNLSGNCVGDSAFIFVPNSQQNIKYQLTLNSGVIDSLYGNTYVINFKHLAIDSNTVYNVIAYDTSDGCNLLLQPSVNISIPTGPPTPVFYQGDTVIKPDSASCYAAYSSGSFLIRYSIDSGGASIDSMSGCISGVTGNYIIRATAVTASYCASSYARLYVRVTTSGDTTHYTKLQSARSSSPMNPPVRQWEFTGGGAGIGGNWLEGLVQTSDGGYVGVGYCGTEQADLYYPDILKLSPDGIPQWHTIIQTPLSGGSVNNSAFNQIIKIQHPVNIGSVPVAYIASCQFTNSSDPYGTKQQEIFIAAFDINGNELEDGWLYNSLLGGAFYSGPNAYGRTYLGGIKETPSGNLVISGYSNTWALTASGGTNKNTDLFVCEIQQDFSHSAGGVNFVWGSVESILGSSTVSTTGLFRAESGNPALNWRGNDMVVQPTGTNYNYNLFVVGNDDQTTSSDDTRVNESGATVTVSGNKSNVSLFQFNVTEADYPSATVTTPLTTNGFPVNWPIDYDLTGLQTTTSTGFGKTYAPSITEMTNPPYKAGATPGNPTATIPIPSSGSTAVDFFGNLHQDRGYTLAFDPNNAGQLIILAQVNYFQSTPNGASSIKSEAFPFNLYAGTTTTNANGGLNELPQGAMGTTEAAFCDPGIGYYTDENIVLFKVNTSSGAVTAPATEVMHCSGFDYFPRLAVDNSGYIYVTGSTGDDHNISGVYGTGPGTVDNLVGSNSRWLANVVTAMHVEKMNNDFSPYWEFTQVGHHPPVNNQEPQTALNPNGTAGPNGWEQATENPFECCFALCLNNEGGFLIGGNNFSRYQDFVIHKFYEDCEPNSYYNNAPVFSSNTTHTINLAGTDPYKGTMIIPSGTTVNISSGTMQFANSRHTIDFANFNQPISNPSKIIIQPGGTLNLTDVILEGMNNCLGQNLQWEGIELKATLPAPKAVRRKVRLL